MPLNRSTNAVALRLSALVAKYYRGCLSDEIVAADHLREEANAYWEGLQAASQSLEFIDLDTASRVHGGCIRLLAELEDSARKGQDDSDQEKRLDAHLAVQAAVRYFILEDDAEGDDSIIGFDDDLQVVEATAKVLGVSLSD